MLFMLIVASSLVAAYPPQQANQPKPFAFYEICIEGRCAGVPKNLNVTVGRDIFNNITYKVNLSNGRETQIKIMPDTASARAIEVLGLRVCNKTINNCTIILKEVKLKRCPPSNCTRIAYEIQVQRHFRILGLFLTKAQVKINLDAENNEIIGISKPWWAYLSTQPKEQ